jgi:hypothetical protein
VIPRASWASVVMAASSLESRTASLVVPAPSFANASPNSSLSMEARVTVLLYPPDRPLWAFVVVEQQQQLKTRGASDGNEPARDEPKGSLEPDRQFYWLGSRARAGRGKSCFEAEARGQEAVHGHVNFLVCVYASVNQSDKSDRPEEFSAASASESAVLRTCFV